MSGRRHMLYRRDGVMLSVCMCVKGGEQKKTKQRVDHSSVQSSPKFSDRKSRKHKPQKKRRVLKDKTRVPKEPSAIGTDLSGLKQKRLLFCARDSGSREERFVVRVRKPRVTQQMASHPTALKVYYAAERMALPLILVSRQRARHVPGVIWSHISQKLEVRPVHRLT